MLFNLCLFYILCLFFFYFQLVPPEGSPQWILGFYPHVWLPAPPDQTLTILPALWTTHGVQLLALPCWWFYILLYYVLSPNMMLMFCHLLGRSLFLKWSLLLWNIKPVSNNRVLYVCQTFDDSIIFTISPAGSLRVELREKKINAVILSSLHNTDSHHAVSPQQSVNMHCQCVHTLQNCRACLCSIYIELSSKINVNI